MKSRHVETFSVEQNLPCRL